MKRTGFVGAYWPTAREELMLKAALLDGQDALDSWKTLAPVFDLDRIGGDALRLAALLGQNLQDLGADDPVLGRLRGLYRRNWYRNQILFRDAAISLEALRAEGIPTMVLKGAALVALGLREDGVRPMSDVDILVPRPDAHRAIRVLDGLGGHRPKRSPEDLVRIKYGVLFRTNEGTACDLHWRVMKRFESGTARSPEPDFWEHAQPATVGGAETTGPGPADHLFLICTHGAWWSPPSRVRWVADAQAILNGVDKVDWDRVTELARTTSSVLPMRETLTYLRRLLGGSAIPSETIGELDQISVGVRERETYRLAGRRPSRWLGGRPLAAYARLSSSLDAPEAIAGFPQFLRDYYRVDSLRKIPRQIER